MIPSSICSRCLYSYNCEEAGHPGESCLTQKGKEEIVQYIRTTMYGEIAANPDMAAKDFINIIDKCIEKHM